LIINQKTSTCCRKETAKQSKRFQAKGMPKPTKIKKLFSFLNGGKSSRQQSRLLKNEVYCQNWDDDKRLFAF